MNEVRTEGYHYTECGLDNIRLMNGYEFHDTPYGPSVSIQNVDGLHEAIGLNLATQSAPLKGKEVRFLRLELDLSQASLAALLGVEAQSVARWEKNKTGIPGPAQRLLAGLYRESVSGCQELKASLQRLADLDAEHHRLKMLAMSDHDQWTVCAA